MSLRFALLGLAGSLVLSCGSSRDGTQAELVADAWLKYTVAVESARPAPGELDASLLPSIATTSHQLSSHMGLSRPWSTLPWEDVLEEQLEAIEWSAPLEGSRIALGAELRDEIERLRALLEADPTDPEMDVRQFARDLGDQTDEFCQSFNLFRFENNFVPDPEGPEALNKLISTHRLRWSTAHLERARELAVVPEGAHAAASAVSDQLAVSEFRLKSAIGRAGLRRDSASSSLETAEKELADASAAHREIELAGSSLRMTVGGAVMDFIQADLALAVERQASLGMKDLLGGILAEIETLPSPQTVTYVTAIVPSYDGIGISRHLAAGGPQELSEEAQREVDHRLLKSEQSQTKALLDSLKLRTHEHVVSDPRRTMWEERLAQLKTLHAGAPERTAELERDLAAARELLNGHAQQLRDLQQAQLRRDVAIWQRAAFE